MEALEGYVVGGRGDREDGSLQSLNPSFWGSPVPHLGCVKGDAKGKQLHPEPLQLFIHNIQHSIKKKEKEGKRERKNERMNGYNSI